VAVIGGGVLGCELALALAAVDNTVTVLEALGEVARTIEPVNRFDLLDRLAKEPRVEVCTNSSVRLVDDRKIYFCRNSGESEVMTVDQVVWATGYRPRDLDGQVSLDVLTSLEIKRIGDCQSPRNVFYAIRDGFQLATQL
jgi:2-enoate reductase